MPQHRSATRRAPPKRAARCRAIGSDDDCSYPARVNSISIARLNFALAASRSSCCAMAAATRLAGYSRRKAAATASSDPGASPSSTAARVRASRPSGDSSTAGFSFMT